MSKYLFILLLLLPLYGVANSFDLPVVHSIKNGNKCEISFSNKIISTHDCEYESPSYLSSYSLLPGSWTGVWIFQDAPMGNSCEAGAIRVVSMNSEKKIETHNLIDYCSGKVVINNDGNQVEIIIRDDTNKENSEAWLFKGNKLKKIK